MEKLADIKKALMALSDSIHEYDMAYWCSGIRREAIEEIEAICILLFSLAIGFVIFQAFSFYGRQYEKNLESAIQKQKKDQELTKKESRILSDFDRYKNNF